ncbi:hypothetical protein ACFWFI_09665 [Streptomyces sp. NPDC060209]|uniref:hypothetical protein n=1 Tax=Streptomyces sp. NPDC060209 TaxID=3347073 RepID=UPI003663888F
MATTAQQLLAFRQELIDGGLHRDEADELVRDASHALVRHPGLVVATPEAAAPAVARSRPLPPRD